MASSQDRSLFHHRRNPSQESRTSSNDGFQRDQSAYWTTVNSHSEDTHLAPPPLFSSGSRVKNKPASLRNLMRRRTEGDSEEQEGTGTSAGLLSPNYQAEPLHSAPPTVTTYAQPPRSHSQPPAARAVSAHYMSPTSSFDVQDSNMYGHSSHASESWANHWTVRPASTYPPPHSTQHYEERPHSYFAGQSQPSYQHNSYSQQPSLGYHTHPSPSQSQPNMQTSSQPSQLHRESVDEGFDNPTESAMFAEALSGFSGPSTPFTLQSPQSPPGHTSYASPASLQLPVSRPPLRAQTTNIQPNTSNFYLQPSSSYSYTSTSSFNDNRSPNHAMNLAILSISGDEDDRPPDDELPDYAQSQAEEAAKRRQEAATRAAELEQRWAAGRRRY